MSAAEILERYEDKILETGLLTDMLPSDTVINGITIRTEPGDDDQNLTIDIWTEGPVEIDDFGKDDIGFAVQEYIESKGGFTELGFSEDACWIITVNIKQ
jgi:hypothetical protein